MDTTYTTYTRYCPSCSALVEEPEADHCVICGLAFAANPPVATSPELDREREAVVAAEDRLKTPRSLRPVAWLAEIVGTVFMVGIVIVILLVVIAVGVFAWNAIF